MIAFAMEVASWACIVLGSFFTIVGMLGLLRMPELFTRMHAASVMETLGARSIATPVRGWGQGSGRTYVSSGASTSHPCISMW